MFLKTISYTTRGAVAAAVLSFACLAPRADVATRSAFKSGLAPEADLDRLPSLTYWTWERTEDLRSIDPAHTAVAYLDQTILIGTHVAGTHVPGAATRSEVAGKPRRQSVTYPAGETLIAVVRIEVEPRAELGVEAQRRAAALLLGTAATPGIAALQVDFDAVRSQRSFYRGLLGEVRRRMPPTLPLSITALASWCSYDDWIADLPVQEAVPMLFRMEPDWRRAAHDTAELRITEPLCSTSVGVSTHEAWPENLTVGPIDRPNQYPTQKTSRKRIYIFADRGWRADLASLNHRKLP